MEVSRRKMILSTGALLGAALVPGSSSAVSNDPVEKTLEEKSMDMVAKEPIDLSECINLYDVEKIAKDKMSKMAYEYIASGAADEITVKWNKEVLDNIKLNPSLLVDVSKINTKITLLGTELAYPILIAPSAYHKIIHPEGERATVKGASASSALYVISSHTTTSLEEISKEATQPLWFQLYIQDDREFTRELVQKVIAQGCKALCITIDTPTTGCRDRQVRSRFKLPDNVHAPYMHDRNMVKAGKTPESKKPLTWKDIEWIKSFSTIPVVLKGIMNPLDAEQAIKVGADAIIVSNHGGRNLDTLPATAEVMPRIADKVAGKIPLLMDGGIRRGTDVVKAIALGADAVLVGRPVCYGLGAGGAAGVKKVMDILKTELEIAMTLCGTPTIQSIDKKLIF
jgi:4-hydroxymandelate oxidase